MRANRYSDAAFAVKLNVILARKGLKPISARSVAKWRLKERGTVPRPATQLAIMELTQEAVTPTHFVTAEAA